MKSINTISSLLLFCKTWPGSCKFIISLHSLQNEAISEALTDLLLDTMKKHGIKLQDMHGQEHALT